MSSKTMVDIIRTNVLKEILKKHSSTMDFPSTVLVESKKLTLALYNNIIFQYHNSATTPDYWLQLSGHHWQWLPLGSNLIFLTFIVHNCASNTNITYES